MLISLLSFSVFALPLFFSLSIPLLVVTHVYVAWAHLSALDDILTAEIVVVRMQTFVNSRSRLADVIVFAGEQLRCGLV